MPRLLTSLILLFELIFCLQSCSRIVEALSAKERVLRYDQELSSLKKAYDEKLATLHYVRSDRYVEDVARADLGWSLEGDVIFMVSEKALPSPFE